jgi:hypothetical protein
MGLNTSQQTPSNRLEKTVQNRREENFTPTPSSAFQEVRGVLGPLADQNHCVMGKKPIRPKGKNCYQDIVGDLFGVNSKGMGKFLEVSEECCDSIIAGGRLLGVGIGSGV